MTETADRLLSPTLFPLFFIGMWLLTTTLLALLSGWFFLMMRYPDRAQEPTIMTLPGQSASMGLFVGMGGILTLSVCPSGLRVHIMRIFGPFCRDFFVPWREIAVFRKESLLSGPQAVLRFGPGRLVIEANVADRLRRSAPNFWPESGPLPASPSKLDVFLRYLKQWLLSVILASLFVTFAPRLMGLDQTGVPVAVAFLFPAFAFGAVFLARFLIEVRSRKSDPQDQS